MEPDNTIMTLAAGMTIATAARALAAESGLKGIAVAVLDHGGAPILVLRDDAQGPFGIQIATAKARTALGFRRSTQSMAAIFTDPAVIAGLAGSVDGGVLFLAGGVMVENGAGVPIGAVGVGGGLPATDHEIASKAILAAGFQVGK